MRQKELAEIIGYEQSYVSALEIGAKGPPKRLALAQIAKRLNLTDEEARCLYESADRSRRRFSIPSNASTRIYEICHALEKRLPCLDQTQLELIELALRLNERYLNRAEEDIEK